MIEFAQWLHYNKFPLRDVLDQVEWAIDILFNMKFESVAKKEGMFHARNSVSIQAKNNFILLKTYTQIPNPLFVVVFIIIINNIPLSSKL